MCTENNTNVLIAAQDVRLAGLIQEFLLKTGYKAQCETNLDLMLEVLGGTQVDLLIIDGEMPEKVLKDFVETAAKIKPGVPMIAVGMSEHEVRSKTLSAFVTSFIEKPFSISEISNTIKATLHTHLSKHHVEAQDVGRSEETLN